MKLTPEDLGRIVSDVREAPEVAEHYRPVTLETERGDVACRYYPVAEAAAAAIWVGGVGGGWDTPARALYPRLCVDLRQEGIASLRVRFRDPRDLGEAVFDVLAGLVYLRARGIGAAALIGHSFGGAVVIQAAAMDPTVRTVVTLATQSYGAESIARLAPRCSILLIHGALDGVLPARSSRYLHEMAREPKRLIIYPQADHMLDQAADEIYENVREWLVERLSQAVGQGPGGGGGPGR